MKTLICISTFKKPLALRGYLQNLSKNGYVFRDLGFVICDDDNGSSREVYEEFKPTFIGKLFYTTGPNSGISLNKNRGIKFFLEHPEYSHLILSDDDLTILDKDFDLRLIETLQKDNISHLTCYLGDYKDPLTKKGFFSQFPITARTKDTLFVEKGTQGIFSIYTRELIEKVMYFKKFPFFYGYEHAEHSARCQRVEGLAPELYPLFAKSPKYLACAGVPNEYSLSEEDIKEGVHGKNGKFFAEQINLTANGIGLLVKNHNLDLSKEIVL